MKHTNLMQSALLAALLCIISPWVIPVGTIPLSLASFGIYTVCSLVDLKRSVLAVVIYIILGSVGLPIFAGFMGGAQVIFGPTGGYIIGYLAAAVMIPILSDKIDLFSTLCISTLAIYLFGTAWYIAVTGTEILQAIVVCVLPFIITDLIKIGLACFCVPKIKTALKGKL